MKFGCWLILRDREVFGQVVVGLIVDGTSSGIPCGCGR